MLKPVTVNMADIHRHAPEVTNDSVNSVFKVMHGFYGNLFLSKFATGDVDAKGNDNGVISARSIWAYGLRDFDLATVKTALSRCMTAHTEYPPTLPQFVTLCKACEIRKTFAPAPVAIEMSEELQQARKERNRAMLAECRAKVTHTPEATPAPTTGLAALVAAIGDAVANAGGDAACEMLRLDRMLGKAA